MKKLFMVANLVIGNGTWTCKFPEAGSSSMTINECCIYHVARDLFFGFDAHILVWINSLENAFVETSSLGILFFLFISSFSSSFSGLFLCLCEYFSILIVLPCYFCFCYSRDMNYSYAGYSVFFSLIFPTTSFRILFFSSPFCVISSILFPMSSMGFVSCLFYFY